MEGSNWKKPLDVSIERKLEWVLLTDVQSTVCRVVRIAVLSRHTVLVQTR